MRCPRGTQYEVRWLLGARGAIHKSCHRSYEAAERAVIRKHGEGIKDVWIIGEDKLWRPRRRRSGG